MELRLHEAIQQYATNKRLVAQRARTIVANKQVTNIRYVYDAENKNPYMIIALVQGTRPYVTQVGFSKNGNYRTAACTCPAFQSYSGLCKHCLGVLFAAEHEQKKRGTFSWELYNPNDSFLNHDEQSGKVGLYPLFVFDQNECYVELKIGRKRKYIIKSIPRLLQDVQSAHELSYGKELRFIHHETMFNTDAQALLTKLSQIVKRKKSNDFCYQGVPSERRMRLTPQEMLSLMVSFDGGVAIQQQNERPTIYTPVEEMPPYRLIMDTVVNKLCITYAPEYVSYAVYGSLQHAILLTDTDIYYFTQDNQQEFSLLRALTQNKGVVYFESDRLHNFLTTLYPFFAAKIDDHTAILAELQQPHNLVGKLSINLNGIQHIEAMITYTYGAHCFQSKRDSIESVILSELMSEYGLENQLLEYGFYRSSIGFTLSDPDAIYEFIYEHLSALNDQYHVEVSEDFGDFKKPHLLQPTIGVRLDNDLLKFDLTELQFSADDYAEVQRRYRLKKKYYRFKDGRFLSLQTPSMRETMNILERLAVDTQEMLQPEVIRSKYEALFVHDVLQHSEMKTVLNSAFTTLIHDFEMIGERAYVAPTGLMIDLRPYQEKGVVWLQTLAQYGMGGILADDMGLGKTLQIIALILAYQQSHIKDKQHIIIAPKSLIYNWKAEFKKFAPTIRVLVVSGTPKERLKKLQCVAAYDVVLTSYDSFRRDCHNYESYSFQYAILDEAHTIKNALTQGAKSVKKLHAQCRFALTGTPIENALSDLWSLFDFILPSYLGTYQNFRKEYELPIMRKGDERLQKRLHRLTAPFLLRRLKQEVLTELPEKIETIMYCEFEKEQQKLYEQTLIQANREFQAELALHGEQQARTFMWTLLLRLRQLCCHPTLYLENYEAESAKFQLCLELVEESLSGNHQVLIFSQFTAMLDVLSTQLTKDGKPHFMLTGKTSAKERLALVDRFNAGEVPIFLISLKAGGTGLNLTGADIVIHYDPWWNMSAQNQATDRAYRMGQKNTVQVYQLIAKNTIEEKISRMQHQKQALSQALVHSGETFINQLSPAEIQSLFLAEITNDM